MIEITRRESDVGQKVMKLVLHLRAVVEVLLRFPNGAGSCIRDLVPRGGVGLGDVNLEIVGMQIVTEALF